MPEYLTSRVDVRVAVLATAATLAATSKSLRKLSLKTGAEAAASERLAGAEQHLVEFASSLATYVNKRYPVGSPASREKSVFASVELSLRRLSPANRERARVLGVFQGGPVHRDRGFSCVDCHGGDPTAEDRASAHAAFMPPPSAIPC